ncbi:MAG: imidazolonepropionase [Bacteroidales bacterium]|nr:imidazolonepropionase [Bacteroidales bacterium]
MSLLIKNIKSILQAETVPVKWRAGDKMSILPTLENGWIWIEDGIIKAFGTMKYLDQQDYHPNSTIDATDRMVLPAWCDSHTHMVFPETREIEYINKIKGLSYEEIAKRGGGILNSAQKMQAASEEKLLADALKRLDLITHYGTGAVEIKSGYGLTTSTELKMLRVIKKLKSLSQLTIKATFLGAHAFPAKYRENHNGYIDILVNEMIPKIAEEHLADYIDVFCDKGFYSVDETERVLDAGKKYGLRPKIHANELDFSGGIETGVKYDALSVDHLEFTAEEQIKILKNSHTMPTLLPGAAFFLGMNEPPARLMINSGLPVAMATDYNPGSSPSGNMQFIIALGAIRMRMIPEETINAVTINSAYAMGVNDTLGTIAAGKKANIIITKKIPTVAYLPYAYGDNKIETVILNGKVQEPLSADAIT